MMQDKILGALAAAAVGDAMGAPLNTRPIYLIRKDCADGGFVRGFVDPPAGAPAPGLARGMVTDSFSLAYVFCERFAAAGGVTTQAVRQALLDWRAGPFKFYYESCADPSTREAVEKLADQLPDARQDKFTGFQRTINSSAAARAWVAGLFCPGDPEGAVKAAIQAGLPTHDNVIALSGACAVAAGVACALQPHADTAKVLEAGLYGAQAGYKRAEELATDAAGASVEKRIRLAAQIGLRYSGDFEGCIQEMTDLVGTGTPANESVPAAFGFLVSAGGDVMETVWRSVNAGNACSMVGTMAGAMAGALKGAGGIPPALLQQLQAANPIDLDQLAAAVAAAV